MTQPYLQHAHPGVASLHPYQPGKPMDELQREMGLERIIKLASNENPLGASPKARAVLAQGADELGRYPDGSGYRLKQCLAEYHGVDMGQITLGNGSNELLELLTRVFLGPGKSVVYSQYGFAVYPLVSQAVGAIRREVPAHTPDHEQPYGHDAEAMLAALDATTRMIFVANPNNPTGTWWTPDEVKAFVEQVPADVIVVLDEAYFDYVDPQLQCDSVALLRQHPNLVITRTFSKVHGLAALRVGYGLSHPDLADLLNRARQPFNNNSLALAAAEVSIRDQDHVRRSVDMNRAGMTRLRQQLHELGLQTIPSEANFITVDMGRESYPIYQDMLAQGVILRPMASYNMPNHLRITIGTEDENRFCMDALKKVLQVA